MPPDLRTQKHSVARKSLVSARPPQVQALAPAFTSRVTFGKLHNISGRQFPKSSRKIGKLIERSLSGPCEKFFGGFVTFSFCFMLVSGVQYSS